MKANWTTPSGKSVEIETAPVHHSFLVNISLKLNGVAQSNTKITKYQGKNVIQFTESGKLNAQKMMVSVSDEIVAQIEAESKNSGKLTAGDIAVSKALDKYEEDYRKTNNAMSK
jgi:hypothetical protein